MRSKFTLKTLSYIASCFIFIVHAANASNLWKEDQIARDIQNIVDPSEVQWLNTDNRQPVFALSRNSLLPNSNGVVVILHDIGQHPDWARVISPLRTQLPESGWNTFSIQLPIPDPLWQFTSPDDVYSETQKRLEAAVELLRNKGHKRMILLAYGASAALSTRYISEAQHEFKALVLISIPHDKQADDWRNITPAMNSINLPTLDIFAEHDLPEVTGHAHMRLTSARVFGDKLQESPPIPHSQKVRQLAKKKTNNLWFRQIKVISATPGFPDHNKTLVKYIRGWLKHYAVAPALQ